MDVKAMPRNPEEETRDMADLLHELEECFGAEEKCGEAVHAKLAEVANNGVRCKLNQDKIKEAGDKYLRPKNVGNLVTPKVNNEIWGDLTRKIKNQDLRLQKTQALICKAIMPQLQLLDILLKANENKGQKIAPKDIIIETGTRLLKIDGVCLLRHVVQTQGTNHPARWKPRIPCIMLE